MNSVVNVYVALLEERSTQVAGTPKHHKVNGSGQFDPVSESLSLKKDENETRMSILIRSDECRKGIERSPLYIACYIKSRKSSYRGASLSIDVECVVCNLQSKLRRKLTLLRKYIEAF
jgi:hypothetical protein